MCITSVPKTEPFGLLFFFVRNPYTCKFWDLIFEENGKKKQNPKVSVLGTLGIHMRITCQNFNFQLEKTAREIAFFDLGSNPGCRAEWNI